MFICDDCLKKYYRNDPTTRRERMQCLVCLQIKNCNVFWNQGALWPNQPLEPGTRDPFPRPGSEIRLSPPSPVRPGILGRLDLFEKRISYLEELFVRHKLEPNLTPDPEPVEVDLRAEFERELGQAINRNSMENGSDTPDFILAQFLLSVLESVNNLMERREAWYGRPLKRTSAKMNPNPIP